MAVLAEAGDWVTVEHLIVYVDRGTLEVATELTHVGPSDDLGACREWLSRLPGRRGTRS
jgi:hypothetical protein